MEGIELNYRLKLINAEIVRYVSSLNGVCIYPITLRPSACNYVADIGNTAIVSSIISRCAVITRSSTMVEFSYNPI